MSITHTTSLSCTYLNRFSIKSIQGMVAQPAALRRGRVFKNKFENIVCLKTLPYEEYELVI